MAKAMNINTLMTDTGGRRGTGGSVVGKPYSSSAYQAPITTKKKADSGAVSSVGKVVNSLVSKTKNTTTANSKAKTPSSGTTSSTKSLPKTSGGSTGKSSSSSSSGYKSGGGSSGGSSASSGPTDAEKKAAENQTAIAKQNVKDVQAQLARQLSNYDLADKQNKALWQTQLLQNSRKTSEDRFEAQRDLVNATIGLLASMGGAMNGSATGNLMSMLRDRNDKENNTFWAQHQVNQDQVTNSYNDSLNQNVVARRDAMQSAEKAIKDITADWMANMNNINPELYKAQTSVGGDKTLAPSTVWDTNKAKENIAQLAGYVMPDQTIRSIPARNTIRGNDYFAQLMNRFNGR